MKSRAPRARAGRDGAADMAWTVRAVCGPFQAEGWWLPVGFASPHGAPQSLGLRLPDTGGTAASVVRVGVVDLGLRGYDEVVDGAAERIGDGGGDGIVIVVAVAPHRRRAAAGGGAAAGCAAAGRRAATAAGRAVVVAVVAAAPAAGTGPVLFVVV